MRTQPIWIIFSVLFLILTIFHFYQSTRSIGQLENTAKVKSIAGINLGISEFINDFNRFISNRNKESKAINIITGVGYLAACLTSLYSYFLS